jgi:hypothetical protein
MARQFDCLIFVPQTWTDQGLLEKIATTPSTIICPVNGRGTSFASTL